MHYNHRKTLRTLFLASLIGGLPPAVLTLTTFGLAAENGLLAPVLFCIGSLIAEAAWFILAFSKSFTLPPKVNTAMELLTIAVLMAMGINGYFAPPTPEETSGPSGIGASSFLRGIYLTVFNPFVLPFWMALRSVLPAATRALEKPNIRAWMAAALSGTTLAFSTYIILGILIGKSEKLPANFLTFFLPIVYFGTAVFLLIRVVRAAMRKN